MAYEGRRRELITAAVLYLLGALITATAPGLSVLLVGRVLYGLGIGLVRFCEVAPTEKKEASGKPTENLPSIHFG